MHDLVIRGGTVVDGTGAPRCTADVAITGDTIMEVGRVAGRGRREIEADGLVVAPGWIDVHTHYDGQALWDPELTPSSWHGVTTAVLGNCGIGFAPVRPHDTELLVELMECVEDIPGATLHAALEWRWESFPEYLDALDAQPRTIDVAAQLPHVALRAYVMGERAHDDSATADDIAAMSRLAESALRAGAVGISTSRSPVHVSRHGYVPGTNASHAELFGLADAIRRAGHGMFQLLSDKRGNAEDRSWMVEFVERSGGPLSYILSQTPRAPRLYQSSLASASDDLAAGRRIVPQVGCRPAGSLFCLQSSLHPFITHPTWCAMQSLPLAEQVARLRSGPARAALLRESCDPGDLRIRELIRFGSWERWDWMFRLGEPPDYEPSPQTSVAATAAREGRAPQEVALDWMLERAGKAFLYAPAVNYVDGNHDVIRELLLHPGTVTGLSDAGAHCATICDASVPTYLLSHWVTGRTRGARLSLEQAVSLQTGRPAEVWGFADRGVLTPGRRADVNIVDLDHIGLTSPEMVWDLPAGARRLVQRSTGYVATLVGGLATYEVGEATGARPGRVIRA